MFFLYIYNKDWTLLWQTEGVNISDITKKINSISEWTFTLKLWNELLAPQFFLKSNIFEIFYMKDGVETSFIKWFVRKKDISQNFAKIKIEDMWYILQRRYLREDKTYTTSQSWQTIIEDIFTYINGISNTTLSIDCDITETPTEAVEFKRWTSVYKILQDIAENWYEFKVEWNVVHLKSSVGIDRTTNDEVFVEYIYDVDEPQWSNLDGVQIEDDANDFANGVIDKTNASQDVWSELLFENYINEDVENADYIAEAKQYIWDYTLLVKNNDFTQVNVGDLVKVYVYSWNKMLFYDGAMQVVEKGLQVSNLLQVSIKVSKNKIKVKDMFEQFKELQWRVGKLET